LLTLCGSCQTVDRKPKARDALEGSAIDAALVDAAVGAHRAAIADLDGDGGNEIVLVDPSQLRVISSSGTTLAAAPVTGGIQVLRAADIDGDDHVEVIAGWGQTREHMDARTRFTVHRLVHARLVEDVILAPTTTRDDTVAIVPLRDARSVLLAYFESKYMVTSVVMSPQGPGWKRESLATIRTAVAYASGDVDGDGAADLVVGRVYGDEIGIDGDAFLLGPGGERRPIPTTRGVRSIAIAGSEPDGRNEIFLGDGWHQNYGKLARGQLTWIRVDEGGMRSELIEDTPGQYAIEQIVPAMVGGRPVLVTRGSAYVRVFHRDGNLWTGVTVATAVARDIAVGELDGIPGDEVLVLADPPQVIHLNEALGKPGFRASP
jgi:hypothetical protein